MHHQIKWFVTGTLVIYPHISIFVYSILSLPSYFLYRPLIIVSCVPVHIATFIFLLFAAVFLLYDTQFC